MKKLFILSLFILSYTIIHAQTVRIAAAGNLRNVLEELIAGFIKENSKDEVNITIGSSGALSEQISNGANFDLFMSADKIYADKLKSQGLVSGKIQIYAYGKLVLWSNTLDISKGLNILTDMSVHRISIAKPEVAPYGDRAVQCLRYYNLYDKVKEKIVFADNIAQAAQYAQTGNAEVGFIAQALTVAPEMKGSSFIIDPKSYKPIEQALVLIKSDKQNPEATKFVNYILSAGCKPVFEKYGFIVP